MAFKNDIIIRLGMNHICELHSRKITIDKIKIICLMLNEFSLQQNVRFGLYAASKIGPFVTSTKDYQ